MVLVPVYLAILLLLKAAQSLGVLVRPVARLIPASVANSVDSEGLLSVLVVLVVSFAVGLAMRTWGGRALRGWLEHAVFEKLPGYALFRSLTMRVAGKTDDVAWKPALAEIEDALVPAFIIEELADGRYTVFVPSVPTPLAGAVYVLDRQRVHPVGVGFAQAIKTLSRWGAGSKDMVAAIEDPPQGGAPRPPPAP